MAEVELKFDIKVKKTIWFYLALISPTLMGTYFQNKPLIKYSINGEKKSINYSEVQNETN